MRLSRSVLVGLLAFAALVPAQESAPESRRERGKRTSQVRGGMWPGRHQEDDGSWSPSDFEFHCDEDNPPLCGGRGRERFRVAATALLVLNYVGAGFDPCREGPYRDLVRRAVGWVLAQQRPDGGFAESRSVVTAMTNACATILVCRVLKALHQPASFATDGSASRSWSRDQVASAAAASVRRISDDQKPDGSWGDDSDEARRLSTTVWNLLALKAGKTADIESKPEHAARGLAWIEKQVAALESRPGVDPGALMRARAARAVARRAFGRDAAAVTSDVQKLVDAIQAGGPAPRDAETLLFGTLAALAETDPLRDRWMKAVKPFMIDDQVKDGCASGTWAAPTIWWDDGGRVVSTALMTWVLELYYRYPMALWVE